MSYWVYLNDGGESGETVSVEQHADGGTYVVGGTTEACLNVTYNYARDMAAAWEAASGTLDGQGGDGSLGTMLHGKRAADVVDTLAATVEILGTERDTDYWKPTKGNAGYALNILLAWARQYPEATFLVH